MSTRSRIGVIRSKNGSEVAVESIYCHFDGYPGGVGLKLRDHWSNPGRVNELIALGDLSQLGEILGTQHDFDSHSQVMRERGTNWCLFYSRDRGEEHVGSLRHPATSWPSYGQEYEYLFDPEDRAWYCRGVHVSLGHEPGKWLPLATAISADQSLDIPF